MHVGYGNECAYLDLQTAWSRVMLYAPSLAITETEIEIREANKRQVSVRPNPIFGAEAENLGVSNTEKAEPPQTTFSISQRLELGGKRRARWAYASSQTGIAYYETLIERQNLHYELVNNFIEVSTFQERLKIALNREEVAQKILEAVEKQVKVGKVSPIQTRKAQLTLKSAQVAVTDALSQLEQAKKTLSAMWGSPCPDFGTVVFNLFDYEPPPLQCLLTQAILNTFDFARTQQQINASAQNLALQRTNRVPDVTLTLGYRIYNESNEHGWVVGAQLPIPIFDKNRGNIDKAYLETVQAEQQRDEVVRILTERALVVYEKLSSAFKQAEMLKAGVLADAQETFNLTETGYQKGKIQYLELLDAQRTLFEIQEQYVNVLNVYHLNRNELDRLSGGYNTVDEI